MPVRRRFGLGSGFGTGGGVHWIAALLAVYLVATALWPLLRLFALAAGPGEDGAMLGLVTGTLASRGFQRAFWNTLWSSSASVVISTALGLGLALATGLVRMRGRALASFLALSPVLIPSQIMALAWIELMGSASPILGPFGLAPAPGSPNPLYSGGGIAWLMGIEHMPLVFVAVRAALAAIPADLIEAARIARAPDRRIVRRIILPLVVPATAAGAMLAFAAAVGNFGIPALLGIPGRFPVLTTLIYQRLSGFGPSAAGRVAVMALVLVLLALAATALRLAVMRRLAVPLGEGPGFAGFPGNRRRPLLSGAVWAVLLALSVLPILALTATALVPALGVRLGLGTASLQNFAAALSSPAIRRAFANSFALALATGVVSAAVAILLAWLSIVARNRLARSLGWLADAGFVVPGTVLAVGVILVYLPPLPVVGVSIYGTGAILLVAYLGRFLPLALRPVEAALAAAGPEYDEAARIAGARPWRRIVLVAAPPLIPAALAGATLIVLTAVNELTLSTLLWSAGHETIGVMIFSMQYEGNSTGAAALSVLVLVLVAAGVVLVDLCARRLPAGSLPWRV